MGGWFHALGNKPSPAPLHHPRPERQPLTGASRMLDTWAKATSHEAVESLASSLGVEPESLYMIGAAWASDRRAWAFPMRDGFGEVVGIRLRAMDGRKWAVTGSRQGVFTPTGIEPSGTMHITEGPTDTAAALSLGLYAVGRPSCCCGGRELKTIAKRLQIRQVVMVTDNDAPGIDGAHRVAKEIGLPYVLLIPPAKDLRQFVQSGGSSKLLASIQKDLKWHIGSK